MFKLNNPLAHAHAPHHNLPLVLASLSDADHLALKLARCTDVEQQRSGVLIGPTPAEPVGRHPHDGLELAAEEPEGICPIWLALRSRAGP